MSSANELIDLTKQTDFESVDQVALDPSSDGSPRLRIERVESALGALAGSPELEGSCEDEVTEAASVLPLTDAQKDLVMQNLALVNSMVFQVSANFPKHMDRDEIASSGMLGLVEAALRFDENEGTPFRYFAARRVKGAMLDHVRGIDTAFRSTRSLERRAESVVQELAAEHGRKPTEEEVARRLGVSLQKIHELRYDVVRSMPMSLEYEPHQEYDGLTYADITKDKNVLEPPDIIVKREELAILRDAIMLLPERKHQVIIDYYLRGYSSIEIAAALNVTESRISQIRSEAIHMLRDAVEAQFEDEPPECDELEVSRKELQRRTFNKCVGAKTNWKDRIS